MRKNTINIKTVKQAIIDLAIERHQEGEYDLWLLVAMKVLGKTAEEITELDKAQVMAAATQSAPVCRGMQNCSNRKKELVGR